jgi:hypothetical protein
MDKESLKQVAYLDLEEIEEKEYFSYFLSQKTGEDVLSLEDRFQNWLECIDR